MSFAAETASIESRFKTQWASRTPVAYANVPFTPALGTSFVRLTVLQGASNQASMGDAPLYRHVGIIDAGVFAPTGDASKAALEHADAVAAIFRGAQFDGITCRGPEIRIIGNQDGWYQVNVSVPYQRDEIF